MLDLETARLYCGTDAASVSETASHVILNLFIDREPDDYWEEPGGQLAAMVQARSELAAGDLRLRALAERQEDPDAFRDRFLELRAQHQRKPSLLDRFDQAGLPS